MKRITAICIIASCILGSFYTGKSHSAPAPAPHKTTCPKVTPTNTGWLIFDEDGDGYSDRQFRVFNTGPCIGQYAGDTYQGEDTLGDKVNKNGK